MVYVSVQLTQKEKMLLKDQMSHEKVCIEKYSNYAQKVQDPELRQLFNEYAAQEQHHYDALNQLLQGQAPSMSAGGSKQGQAASMSTSGSQQAQSAARFRQDQGQAAAGQRAGNQQMSGQAGSAGVSGQADAVVLNDMLMTEKYLSGTYDTAVFESASPEIRQALQHIQREEQQHGEGIFSYMQAHGMYNPQ